MNDGSLNGGRAILVVAFGTTYRETRRANIDAVIERYKEAYPDYEVRFAFTSETIRRTLRERDGEYVDNTASALERLAADGCSQVIIQPLHIIPGREYKKIWQAVRLYSGRFASIKVGRPLLYFFAGEDTPDDYLAAAEALRDQLPETAADEVMLLMAHGSADPANACYIALQRVFTECGLNQVLVACVEGYPSLDDVLPVIARSGWRRVCLMPFMLVAGDHANNDMAGDEEDAWRSVLTAQGYEVRIVMQGLGQNPAVQQIYLQHTGDALADKYARYFDTELTPQEDAR